MPSMQRDSKCLSARNVRRGTVQVMARAVSALAGAHTWDEVPGQQVPGIQVQQNLARIR